MDKLIISYEQGYSDWFISEFYRFFHHRIENSFNIKFVYMPISEFCKKFGKKIDNNNPGIFNWFNLIIFNESNEKMIVHSWNDYGQVIADKIVNDSYNVVLFSSSSNITQELIDNYKGFLNIQPSIYCLEKWSNLNLIEQYTNRIPKFNKAFFIGYLHGIRENIYQSFIGSDFFLIKDRRIPNENLDNTSYYDSLSKFKFGVSLNGVANICYRDLEIFGLGLVNLRQSLKTLTKNRIIKGEHYIEFFDEELVRILLVGQDTKSIIKNKVEMLLDNHNLNYLREVSQNSRAWYLNNCQPDKQYEILLELTENLELLNN